MPLRELAPVRAEDARDVCVHGSLGTERAQHVDLLRGVRDVVVAPDDVRDPVDPVLERRGEVVRRSPVRADEDEILELGVRHLDPTLDRVVPLRRALVRHADPDRSLVLVRRPLGHQPPSLLLRALHHVELERRLPVPVDPEPLERALDLIDRLGDLAARVGVLDAEEAFASLPAREEPVEEERPHAADVEEPRRGGGHANADGHERSSVVACSSAPTSPPREASRRRSTASRRSAETQFRSSRRARACGSRRRTRTRRSRASASAGARHASSTSRAMRCTSSTSRVGTPRCGRTRSRRCGRRWRPDARSAPTRSCSTGDRTSASASRKPSTSSSPRCTELLELTTDDLWLCIENAAGTGGTIGRSVAELAALCDAVDRHPRLGICIDSCHWWASGVDVADADALEAALDELDRAIGLERLRLLHVNDSQTPLGSNRDRHELVGQGPDRGRARDLPRPSRVRPAPGDHGDVGGQGRGYR